MFIIITPFNQSQEIAEQIKILTNRLGQQSSPKTELPTELPAPETQPNIVKSKPQSQHQVPATERNLNVIYVIAIDESLPKTPRSN